MNESILQIPCNIEAEQAVLGSLIEDNELIAEIANILIPESFHSESHQHIFRSILQLFENNEPADEITIGKKLITDDLLEKVGGYPYLAELIECAPSSGNIAYYAKIIKEDAVLRDGISITTDFGRKARDPRQNAKDLIQDAVSKLTELSPSVSNAEKLKDIFQRNFEKMEYLSENRDEITGVSTGYIDLDKITCGLQPQDLIILAARPSMGKSALALNIAMYAAGREKGAILIFSLEMSKEQLATRSLSYEGKIDNKKLRTGNLDQEDWDKLAMATGRLSELEIIIDDRSNISALEIISTVKYYDRTSKNGVSLVVVDYMQLMSGDKKGNREQEISGISRSLKGLAKDVNIPVIALSQLNRGLENRTDKEPKLSDLRESGSIEQDSDLILFVYRDEVYNAESEKKGIAKIILAKHRNGPTGFVNLSFAGKYTGFYNLNDRYDGKSC